MKVCLCLLNQQPVPLPSAKGRGDILFGALLSMHLSPAQTEAG